MNLHRLFHNIMEKYLNSVNKCGSNHQMYKRCIFNIIKDMRKSIDDLNSHILAVQKNHKLIVVKKNEINLATKKYVKKFNGIDESIIKYNTLYKKYIDELEKLYVKVEEMTSLKKIKEKHVQTACDYLQKITNYFDELDDIDSSINYSSIDEAYRKVQVELSEISLINGLMDGVDVTDYDKEVKEDIADSEEESGCGEFYDFM